MRRWLRPTAVFSGFVRVPVQWRFVAFVRRRIETHLRPPQCYSLVAIVLWNRVRLHFELQPQSLHRLHSVYRIEYSQRWMLKIRPVLGPHSRYLNVMNGYSMTECHSYREECCHWSDRRNVAKDASRWISHCPNRPPVQQFGQLRFLSLAQPKSIEYPKI